MRGPRPVRTTLSRRAGVAGLAGLDLVTTDAALDRVPAPRLGNEEDLGAALGALCLDGVRREPLRGRLAVDDVRHRIHPFDEVRVRGFVREVLPGRSGDAGFRVQVPFTRRRRLLGVTTLGEGEDPSAATG